MFAPAVLVWTRLLRQLGYTSVTVRAKNRNNAIFPAKTKFSPDILELRVARRTGGEARNGGGV
jgi:hypothetical protein